MEYNNDKGLRHQAMQHDEQEHNDKNITKHYKNTTVHDWPLQEYY